MFAHILGRNCHLQDSMLGFGIYTVLIICRFPVCEFAYLMKCICNLQIEVIHRHAWRGQKCELSDMRVPRWDQTRCPSVILFQSSHSYKCSLFSATFSALLCSLWVTPPFKMAPKWSVEVLTSCPKGKKAVMCPMEKIQVFRKPYSGMSYSPVGHEFNVSERTTCI